MSSDAANTVWLVRYGEIALKSPPVRKIWERQLLANIEEVLPHCQARREYGRIWLTGEVEPAALARIFGIVSFSPCRTCDLEDLKETLLDYVADVFPGTPGTFGLRVHRVGRHGFTSPECAARLGKAILQQHPHLSVDLTHPDAWFHIEIRERCGYLFDRIIPGAGGIPLGVEGTLILLFSGGIDSAVAAWLMMKRGCRILPVFIDMPPYLESRVRERALAVLGVLRKYQPDIDLQIIEETFVPRIKDQLRNKPEEKYICLLCKRRMYRLAEGVARESGAKGVVTGESMGQVASQTLDNLAVLHDATSLPFYRPLIGLDKSEIVDLARKIGTYESSILQTGGCGAVPPKPATRAALENVRLLEQQLWEDVGDEM